ncbi:type II toxin-antitoxin system VapC family toxin [Pseudonocardia nematodicida]|uniref:Ribonuclease VapC n=1 Tax=Pseudonocardia nematodicida TaxID=1206997 RepID=A0ABV1KKB7_9PSEU
MPTSADPEFLVDTSVAVALSTADHEARPACRAVVEGRRIGLAGHAAFETYSVLTRLPAPGRRTASAVGTLIRRNFPHTTYLDGATTDDLLRRLPDLGISGGSVYDALVGAAAAHAAVPLVTRDRRALGTYRALDVDVVLVG